MIVVKLKYKDYLALNGLSPITSGAIELMGNTDGLGIILKPMHPGSVDFDLVTYYVAELPYNISTTRAVYVLQACSAVEGVQINTNK